MVAEVYRSGPRVCGFDADRWTTARFAEAIQTRFGVHYDPDHVGRIMHRLGLRERRKNRRRLQDVLYGTRIAQSPLVGQPAPTAAVA